MTKSISVKAKLRQIAYCKHRLLQFKTNAIIVTIGGNHTSYTVQVKHDKLIASNVTIDITNKSQVMTLINLLRSNDINSIEEDTELLHDLNLLTTFLSLFITENGIDLIYNECHPSGDYLC